MKILRVDVTQHWRIGLICVALYNTELAKQKTVSVTAHLLWKHSLYSHSAHPLT